MKKLRQKNESSDQIIERLEKRLEDAQKHTGTLTGKFEVEYENMKHRLEDKEETIKELSDKVDNLNTKIYEAEKIEDKILSDLQDYKDKNLKLESKLENKEEELVDLKKKVKLMRRELAKSK